MEALRQDRRPLTVEAVLALAEAGLLGEGPGCELLWGELYTMSPQGPAHLFMTDELGGALRAAYPDARVFVCGPLQLDDINLPEPDLAVVKAPTRALRERLPRASEALLVVEIAWSSQRRDRIKAQLYAQAGVPVYWLLDLQARCVEVYSEPQPDGRYAQMQTLTGEVPLPGDRGSLSLPALLA